MPSISLVLGICGLTGVVYGVIVVMRARRQTGHRPVFEDWLWHAVLPLIAYALLPVAAVMLRSSPQRGLFVVSATPLLLLFIGIHNAWDTVTYIAVGALEKQEPKPPEPPELEDAG